VYLILVIVILLAAYILTWAVNFTFFGTGCIFTMFLHMITRMGI